MQGTRNKGGGSMLGTRNKGGGGAMLGTRNKRKAMMGTRNSTWFKTWFWALPSFFVVFFSFVVPVHWFQKTFNLHPVYFLICEAHPIKDCWVVGSKRFHCIVILPISCYTLYRNYRPSYVSSSFQYTKQQCCQWHILLPNKQHMWTYLKKERGLCMLQFSL